MAAIPSREFMIQQAVLNAAVIWSDPTIDVPAYREPGYFASRHGVPTTLKCLTTESGFIRQSLVDLVRKEFRAIAHSYGIMVI